MALQDKIGRQDIVDKICVLVDSLQKDQNFCLAINGAWGSGKSFVLQMIEEQLSKKQEYVIVKYDAWENTYYSDPLIAILSCVIDGIDNKLYLVERLEEKAKKTIKAAANTLAKLSAKIKALRDIVLGIKNVIKSFHNPIDTEAIGGYKSYQKLLQETKEVLNEITQKGEYDKKQTKLIVLVDEIDRCLPDEQLKILERLHHLLDIKNCAVIVAMNQDCIAKTVQALYGIDGYEYLRKFFDFTYKLETSASEYFKNLLDDFVQSINKVDRASDEYSSAISAAYQCLLWGNKKILDFADNRAISRYYNVLVDICNRFGWGKMTDYYMFFIIVGLYIRKNVSPTFLNEDEIIIKYRELESRVNPPEYPYFNGELYYDFFYQYVGIDRKRLPKEIFMSAIKDIRNVPELSRRFNEIIYYSLNKNPNGAIFIDCESVVNSEDCQELRRLIILYGGEQELCGK